MSSVFLFYLFAAVAVVSAIGMVSSIRNTVAGAMSLVVTMISLAGIYVLMEAHFVAALQIIIYAGAIVVLFLFVVMLLNLRQTDLPPARQRLAKAAVVGVGVLVLARFATLLPDALAEPAVLPEGFGGYRAVGADLFTRFVLPFETTSLLLLAAMVGAVVLAKRRID